MLPRPAQGPGLWARGPPPGTQEAGQEAQEQAAQDRKGHLTGPAPSPTPPTSVDGQPQHLWVKSQAKTVSRWAKEGKLPFLKTLGGHRRFPEAEIRELAEELREEAIT
jgi:excisionase family DNA binding protein